MSIWNMALYWLIVLAWVRGGPIQEEHNLRKTKQVSHKNH